MEKARTFLYKRMCILVDGVKSHVFLTSLENDYYKKFEAMHSYSVLLFPYLSKTFIYKKTLISSETRSYVLKI